MNRWLMVPTVYGYSGTYYTYMQYLMLFIVLVCVFRILTNSSQCHVSCINRRVLFEVLWCECLVINSALVFVMLIQ